MDEKLQALVSQLLNEGKSEEEIRDFIRQYKEENVEELAFSADSSGFDFGKTNVYGTNQQAYGQSFYTYGGEEDVPVEEYSKLANVFRRGNLSLQTAWASTAITGAEFVNFLDKTGAKTMQFILGEDDAGIAIVDPDNGEIIEFNKEAYELNGKDAIENQRWYEITGGDQPYDMIHKETGRRIGESMDKFIIDQYAELSEINKKIQKADIGKGIVGGFKEGDLGDVAIGIANALTSTVTTVVPAILTRGMSLAPQIMAPMYTEYNSEKAKMLYGDDSEESIAKLLNDNKDEVLIPFGLGLAATALERIGIKGISSYVLNKARTAGAKRLGVLTLTGLKEGTTEYYQGGLNVANKSLAQGDNMDIVSEKIYNHMTSEHALEEFLQGVVGGTGISAGGAAIQSAFRNDNDNIQVNNYINNLVYLNQKKLNSNSPDVKISLDKEIKKTEKAFKNFIILNQKRSEYLTNNQSKEIVNILDSRKKIKYQELQLNKQKNQGVINKDEFNLSIKDINEQLQIENKKLNDIKVEANKKLLHDDLRVSEKAVSKTKDLSQKVYKTPADFLKAVNAKSKKQYTIEEIQGVDGLFMGGEMMINETVAAETNAVTVGSHELLHGIVKSSITGKTREITVDGKTVKTDLTVEGAVLIKDFLDTLSKKERSVVQKRIDDNYKYNRDKDGNIISEKAFEQYAEEYLNVYADAAIKNEISDSLLVKIGKFLSKIFNTGDKGYKNLEFKTGKDVNAFLKAYVSDRKKGKYRQQFIEMAQEGVGMEKRLAKKSITRAVKKDLTPKQATDEVNKIGKTNEFGDNLEGKDGNAMWEAVEGDDAARRIQEQGLLDKLILKQLHVGVDDASFLSATYAALLPHIRNYKPERKNPNGLFGWINPQIGNKAKQAYNDLQKGKTTQPTVDIGQTTKEGEVKIQVAAEKDIALEALETEDLSPAAQARKRVEAAKPKIQKTSQFRKAIGIETGGEIYNRVLDAARKALIRAYKSGQAARNIQRNLRDEANVYLFKTIKNFLGTNQYINNLKKFREPIIDVMFTADLVQMEREVADNKKVFIKFVKQLTSKKEVQDAVNNNLLPASALNVIDKGQAVSLYKKVMPTEEQFIKFFDQPAINPKTGKRSGLKGTRKDQVAKYMAGALTYDATMQVAQEPDVIQKRSDIAALNGENLAEDNLETLAAEIGRDPSIKFSKSFVFDSKKGFDIIYGQDKNDGFMGKNFQNFLDNKNIDGKTKRYVIDEYVKRDNEQFNIGVDAISKKELNSIKTNMPTHRKYEKIAAERLKNIFKKANLKSYKVQKLSEKDNNPDIVVTKNGNTVLAIEIKGNTARGVSVTFNYKGKNKGLVKSTIKEETDNYNKKELSLINSANKVFEDIINTIEKTIGKDQYRYTSFGNLQLTQDAVNIIKKQGVHLNIFKNIQFITPGDVANSYQQKKGKDGNLKPSHIIDFGNAGMFNMSTDFELQIEGLNNFADQKAPIPLTARVVFGKLNAAKTHRTISIRIEPQLNSLFFEKQNISLINKKNNKNINLKFSKGLDLSEKISIEKVISDSRSVVKFSKTKGASIFDFDETVGVSENFVIAKKGNLTEKIASENWPLVGETLKEQGYEFDFTDFNKVTKGKPGPLLQKMKNQIDKYGSKNVFILTARAPESQQAIHDWLESEGAKIPLENITGLGDSTGEAKAAWILDKYSEKGYNDIYFVDDALQNVRAVKKMFDQLDIKGKSVQAKIKFSKSIDKSFNKILEDVSGIDTKKVFSEAKAKKRGEGKGRFRLFVPPSHEDFVGLLYNFMGKGEKGNKHRAFFEKALIEPLNRAYRELNIAKQAIANDYKNLVKQVPDMRKKLTEKTPDGDFTYSDAVRVYLWDRAGFEIPGLSKTDKKALVELVNLDGKLKRFALKIGLISRIKEGYIEPNEHWITGDIRTDLADATGRVGRKKFFAEFIENADIVFSKENINKIRAIYGDNFVEALQDVLYRTKNGTNRTVGPNRIVNGFLDYINGSIGATMFFNARSAVLQTLSTVNFINYGDNNVFKAAAAFADQKQFWKDFAMLFNSDMLKQRRAGVAFDVNAAEIASAVSKSKQPVRAAIAHLLQLGFLPTQIADSFAISTGGATMYRNRVNTYLKQGLSKKEAEAKAFTDFQIVAESTQQSARPDMISQQQASVLGRMILAFQNTPSQYVRLIKKAGLDLINRRKTPPYSSQTKSDMSNISRIIYYGAVQNVIFYGLQSALFAMLFDDEEDEKTEKFFKTKKQRVIQGSIDTILRGMGVGGAVISTIKNTVIKYHEEQGKTWNKKLGIISNELLQISPPIGIKKRKLDKFEETMLYNKKVIPEMNTFDIDNPIWGAYAQLVEGATNIPVNRLHTKVQNVRAALDTENAWWQRLATGLGWNKWDVGIENKEIKAVKEDLKINNKKRKKTSRIKAAQEDMSYDNLKALNKQEQINMLLKLGYSKRQAYSLRYEDDRVNKIIQLSKKSK